MAIRVHVKRGQQAIVPIRFVRAVTGNPPVRNAPDVDDRGFDMSGRGGDWGKSKAKGAMVGVTVGDTVRVKVLRDDIENGADLYVSSTNTSVIRVTAPASGTKLPANGEFSIRGIADKKNSPVAVQIHYGKQDGPVIGELEPHIFQLIRIRVAIHLVSIYGGDTNRWAGTVAATTPNMVALVTQANDIWRPAGIEFRTDNMLVIRDQVRRDPGNAARSQYHHRNSNSWRSLPGPLGAAGNFTRAGAITDDDRWGAANQYREFVTLGRLNFVNNRANIYCVQNGISWDSDPGVLAYVPGWNGLSYVGMNRGLAIADAASAYDLAHELGHYLNNNHADEDNTGTDTDNKDIGLVRRLMYSGWPAAAPPHRNNVGYGANQYGALISVKKLAGNYSTSDGELSRSRRRARRPFS